MRLHTMRDAISTLIEHKNVIRVAGQILSNSGLSRSRPGSINNEEEAKNVPLLDNNMDGGIRIAYVAGTILTSEVQRFKRLLFRATKGKALPHFHDMEEGVEDVHGKVNMKTVYVVVFEEGARIRSRVTKICDSFLGQRFNVDDGNFNAKIEETERNIENSTRLLASTKDELKKYLQGVNETGFECSRFLLYEWYLKKEVALYANMNLLKRGEQLFLGFFWCAKQDIPKIKDKVSELRSNRNLQGPQISAIEDHHLRPPTYFRLNDVTAAPQLVVDTYGVPDYHEANPGVFTVVTFPFLFGVMYGDIGHGFILFLFGCYLVFGKDSIEKSNSMLKILLGARYMILMMGFFSFYAGVIYNDFMSIPIELFDSCYQ